MPRRKEQRKRVRTIRHFAAIDRLDPRFHDELHAMLLAGDMQQLQIIDWLAARGCKLSKGAMCRYRKAFLAQHRRRDDALRDAELRAAREVEELLNYASIADDPPPHNFTRRRSCCARRCWSSRCATFPRPATPTRTCTRSRRTGKR